MSQEMFTINNLWVMIAALLVFIMHLGFASLESGLTRSKNTVNILFKNTIIPAMGLLTYALVGFNLMYPGEAFTGSFFGFSGFGLQFPEGATLLTSVRDILFILTLSFKLCSLLLRPLSYPVRWQNGSSWVHLSSFLFCT